MGVGVGVGGGVRGSGAEVERGVAIIKNALDMMKGSLSVTSRLLHLQAAVALSLALN